MQQINDISKTLIIFDTNNPDRTDLNIVTFVTNYHDTICFTVSLAHFNGNLNNLSYFKQEISLVVQKESLREEFTHIRSNIRNISTKTRQEKK